MARTKKVTIKVSMGEQLSSILRAFSSASRRRINDFIGGRLVRRVSKYLLDRSKTRHRTADRLGAKHTGMLEFTQGTDPATSRTGGIIRHSQTGRSIMLEVLGVKGIMRAYRALDIYPRRAKALTIPTNRNSYASTAAQMERRGWHLFSRDGYLWGTKNIRAIKLYKFMRHVHIKRDAHLMPYDYMIVQWAGAAVQSYLEGALK